MWTTIVSIVIGIIFLLTMTCGILWIVDGFRIKKGTYKATQSEIFTSHIGFGFLLAVISLFNALDCILYLFAK